MNYWKRAVYFYHKHFLTLFLIFPFLFIPVFTDCLHSELIRQERDSGELHVMSAIGVAGKGFFLLFSMKLHFVITATLWGYIPIIGWFKDLDHRINWAMASNVLVFEKLRGSLGRKRCVELRKSLDTQMALRTLFTIPFVLTTICLLFAALFISLFNHPIFYWIAFLSFFSIILPLSAVVNTLVYLSIPEKESIVSIKRTEGVKLKYEECCPLCTHYYDDSGICGKLTINVQRYLKQFQSECNSKYFRSKMCA